MTTVLRGAILGCALALSGCASTTALEALTVLRIGAQVYCVAVTEEGKQAIRRAATGGVKFLDCPAGTERTDAP